jgi:hypothetical protein
MTSFAPLILLESQRGGVELIISDWLFWLIEKDLNERTPPR